MLVVGGGAAGVAAAVTAARQGLKVTLVERYGFCGGGAVAGLSGTICGMYEASDDPDARRRTRSCTASSTNLPNKMTERGGLTPPVRYGKTFTRVHDPLVWRETADAMLREAGVHVLLHTTMTDVLAEGGEKIDGISAYTKQGRLSVRAKVTIDASGDGDIAAMAGLPTFMGQDGKDAKSDDDLPARRRRHGEVSCPAYGPTASWAATSPTSFCACTTAPNTGLPRAKIFLFPTPRPNELLVQLHPHHRPRRA